MPLRDKHLKKYSGVLCAVSSLPSKYGIGTFGEAAYRFVDFLRDSKQRFWQMLPLNPLGEGNSPYKSISCFAGEMLYIDLDFLVRDGLLSTDDIGEYSNVGDVNYKTAREFKIPLLLKAAHNFDTKGRDYKAFLKENDLWLDEYSIFAAALDVYKTERLTDLPDGIKYKIPDFLKQFKTEHSCEMQFHRVMQYIFYCQYFELKGYANKNGVKIIGDIPFYVSPDSADVWENPDDFKVGRDFTPVEVAGVPPDIFSASGQLWGNPVYNWQNMRQNKYMWWQKRLLLCKNMYDVLRIDHFRAFADYYAVPYGSKTAAFGSWKKGEGTDFWSKIDQSIGKMNIIAEDLGGEDDADVISLLKYTGFPNMKILQFAFNGDIRNVFLPQNYGYNCVCYTGTHDNDTTLGWYKSADKKQRIMFERLADSAYDAPSYKMIRTAVKSPARLCILPMQDILCLDSSARMNTPGTSHGNWQWRMKYEDIDGDNAKLLKKLTKERN